VTSDAADKVTEYAKGASGNVAPAATISGPPAELNSGPVVNPSGTLFMADILGDSVVEYAKGASGNTTPVATITGPATGLHEPDAVALPIGYGGRATHSRARP
jgi:hypothetical protein